MTFSRNATSAHKQLATATFNIPQRKSLGIYLGCLVFQGRPSISTFEEIITKATKKLEDWKANYFSKAGRTMLIQSHLESLPAPTMQYFQVLSKMTNYLDKYNRHFFWKKNKY